MIAKKLLWRATKARILLSELGVRVSRDLKLDETFQPYLSCHFELRGERIGFRFPLTRLGLRYLREIENHLLRGVVCDTINHEDALALLLGLAPVKIVYKYRTYLRRVTGLARDRKLRNYLIWRRIRCTQLVGGNNAVGKSSV